MLLTAYFESAYVLLGLILYGGTSTTQRKYRNAGKVMFVPGYISQKLIGLIVRSQTYALFL